MKTVCLSTLLALSGTFVAFGGSAGATAGVETEQRTDYDGSFAEVTSSGGACDQVFATTAYHTRHFLTGPTYRTSVLNFTTESGDGVDPSFFEGVSLVGLLGGSNDLYYEKSIDRDGLTFAVLAEGLIDLDVVYLEVSVKAKDAAGDVVCTAKANYSGFN